MSIIFLDIDGVLNSMPYFESIKDKEKDGKYTEISDYHLRKLAQIYHTCNAQIVLASTWKELDDQSNKSAYDMYQYLIRSLEKYDMKIFDKTPDCNVDRPLEIATWLKSPYAESINFVILDDDFTKKDYAKYGIADHLVQTHFFCENIVEGGLQQGHVDRAIQILQK